MSSKTAKNRYLPLYREIQAAEYCLGNGNTGLWYDKFCNEWRSGWTMTKKASSPGKRPKLDWIKTVCQKPVGDGALLKEMCARQHALLAARKQLPMVYTTAGSFVIGLGKNHPVENGFCWHHQLGVPYIPASGVKGLVRNWIENWDIELAHNLLDWFGSATRTEKSTEQSNNQVGCFIFLDALPLEPPQLGCDILTPHMGKWYSKGGDIPVVVPADWHKPVPAPFLVVKNATFSFGVMPRTEEFASQLPKIETCLQKALQWLGVGAKTAVGYGRMKSDIQKNTAIPPEERLREKIRELSGEELAKMFGKKYKKNKADYQEQGLWQLFIQLVNEFHGSTIEGWREMDKKSNKANAYKKLSRELMALADSQ